MHDLTIVTDGDKGRSFRATLLSYATSRSLWAQGGHEHVRPIYATVAVSEAESIPFIRNLQCGRKASLRVGRADKTFECLKSADYQWEQQKHPEGVVWTIFLPSLYRIDHGMVDPDGCRFAIMPCALDAVDEALAKSLADARRDPKEYRDAEAHAARLATARYVTQVAPLFCAYLDRRTRCPLIPDPRFYSLTLAALMDKGLAGMAMTDGYAASKWGREGPNYVEDGVSGGLAFSATHAQLEPVLAECVREYETRGEMRVAA